VAELRAWPAEVKIFPTEGLEYYEQKNFGADQSKSDLILFLDSDVVPEEGWLASLLETFQDPGVQVACGNTYIPPEGFYNKAFALFWFFPLRTKESGLRQTTDRYSKANNIAFRREVFETFRYPSLPTFRGQCAALRKTMGAYGIDTFLQQVARVSHPSPNGLRHFVKRAVCQGHDSVARYRLHEKSHTASLRHSFKWYLGNLRRSLKRISRHYRKVKLGPAGAVGAFGLAVFYYTLGFMGASLAIFRPDFVRRRFAI
jgi:glycosyltransferase involved in cell wall biosynthesis